MKIAIAGLSEGELPFVFDVSAAALDLDAALYPGDVRVSGTISKISISLAVKATVVAVRRATCDRCLAERDVPVSLRLELYYRESPIVGDPARDESEEYRTLLPTQQAIVLDDDVRSALLVEVPLKNLCQDDCKGLCARCGADLNNEDCTCEQDIVDARWAMLATLFPPTDPDREN